MQRPAIVAVFQLFIQSTCLFERPIAIEHDPRVHLGFPFVDLSQAALEDLHARGPPFAQGAADPRDRLVGLGKQPWVAYRRGMRHLG